MSNVITGEAAAQDEIRAWEQEALTAKAELEDMRKAWAILDEPGHLKRMDGTAEDAARAFVAAREVAERGCQALRLELEAARGDKETLVRTVETLQGVATACAEEAKDLQGEVNMLRSALADMTTRHTQVQDLLTKAISERDVARAQLERNRK